MLVCLRARVKTTECELALSFPENNRRTMARRRRCWWDVGCQEQKVDTFLTFLSGFQQSLDVFRTGWCQVQNS